MYLLVKFVSLFDLSLNVDTVIIRRSVNLTSIRWSPELTFLLCKRWSVSSPKPKTVKI